MARRVETERLRELVRLRRMGASGRAVARLLRMGPNTERRYREALARANVLDGPVEELPGLADVRAAVDTALPPVANAPRASSVAAWRPQIAALLEKGLTARATFDRLRLAEPPFRGSYSAVKRACRQLRRAAPRPEDVVIPVETAPGECAYVDFGYAGRLYDPATGTLRRAWAWVLVLGFSRLMVVRLVFDQRIETWLRLHDEALAELGGCVTTIRPDNTRRAVLRAAFAIDGPTELNRSYREQARHYGFKVEPAPPGQPKKRGKVEAAVKHLRNNPLKARDGEPMDQVQAALARWNREIASVRVHGSTGRRPLDMFNDTERTALRPLPAVPFEPVVWKQARVHPDCHVAFRDRLYSVPWSLIHHEVWLRATRSTVEAFHGDERVATHPRHGPRRSTIETHLPEDRRDLRHRGRAFWEERAAHVGPETLAFVRDVFDSDDVLSRLRQVQAIVRHLERHPRRRAEAASRLARHRRDHSYQGVKRILAHALDCEAVGDLP